MNDFAKRGDQVLSNVQTHVTRLDVVSAKGCYLMTSEDRQILDLTCGIAVTSTGHCHPKVVKAIHEQSSKLIHACGGVVYYEPHIYLAEKLRVCVGWDDAQFFFTNSGSEAIEGAIKLAKYTSKKTRLLAFRGGFHGRTLGALSITSSKMIYHDGYQPLLPNVDFLDYPYALHHEDGFLDQLLGQLEAYFEENAHDLAGVVIEPVLGEGGYYPAPKVFLERLRQLCNVHHVLLIFDEIQTGIGRTGAWFAFQKYGLEPDILTVAKGMASGMPMGAVVAHKSLMDQWTPGAHGGTYVGNPVCSAAASATLDVVAEVLPNLDEISTRAEQYLRKHVGSNKIVIEIRVFGYMIGIELTSSDLVGLVLKESLDQDVLLVSCGVKSNVIRIMPALIIEEETLLEGLGILCESIKRVSTT